MATISTRSVYDEPAGDEGLRVLVTRYWPRGVKKEEADVWIRDLGPSKELIKAWKGGRIEWDEFRKSYLEEFREENKGALLTGLKDEIKSRKAKKVTLLCTCRVEAHCHRAILKSMLGKGKR